MYYVYGNNTVHMINKYNQESNKMRSLFYITIFLNTYVQFNEAQLIFYPGSFPVFTDYRRGERTPVSISSSAKSTLGSLSSRLEPPAGQRCSGRNYNGRRCCTPENPCNEGEGDCDGPGDGGQHDGHRGCKGDLVCGSNNCKQFGIYFHEKDDCCVKPTNGVSSSPDSVNFIPGIPAEPPAGQRCKGRNYGQRRCCTPWNPCDEGEGDCDGPDDGGQHDGNRGCKGDLVCGSNNCRKFGLYYHEKDDCCEKPARNLPLLQSKNNNVVKIETKRCQGRNVDKGKCCTNNNPCEEGEGDCESDFDCNGNLICGINNCKQFGDIFHPKDDCCVKPTASLVEIVCSSSQCSSQTEKKPRCQGRNVDKGKCCTARTPCDEGEGDCEDDFECSGSLVCGNNNCKQFGDIFHPKDDCCSKPSSSFIPKPRCQGRNVDKGKCCSARNQCDEGEGDCENDSECSGSLVCGNNNCKQFGDIFHPKDDCCIKPSSISSSRPVSSIGISGIPTEPKPGQRCAGRNYQGRRCCTPENPCNEGEGDCDGPGDGGQHDGHRGCKPGLVCGTNNCRKFGLYFHEKDDCCEKPSSSPTHPLPEIPLGVWVEPPQGEKCSGRNYGSRRCCNPDNPCDIGEGDCDGPGDGGQHDGNQGCKQGLVCGSNNCLNYGSYFHPKDDCCERPDGKGGWGQWQSWSTCSKSCGLGQWTRNRYCKGPDCPHTTQSQQRFCNFNPCPK